MPTFCRTFIQIFSQRFLIGLFAASLALTALMSNPAAASQKVSPAVEASVKKAVEGWLRGRFKVDSVLATPMPGMVEVRIGTDLIYADEKGGFAIVEGQLVDLKTGANLTAARLEDINRINFAKLPLDLAMKTVKGKGQRVLAVFEDPYCSFCRTYRKTLLDMNNVTIYTFFYPMLRAESETVSRNAWCAKNREEAWNDWMLFGKEPAKAGPDCKFDTDRMVELGRSLSVSGTPTTFFSDGRRASGALTKERLEQSFTAAQ
jgi:thiol:disulfide interchange protein DsbC